MISCNFESSLVLLRTGHILTSETVGNAFLVVLFCFFNSWTFYHSKISIVTQNIDLYQCTSSLKKLVNILQVQFQPGVSGVFVTEPAESSVRTTGAGDGAFGGVCNPSCRLVS